MLSRYTVDLAFGNSNELLKTFAKLTRAGIRYKVLRTSGPAGGNPEIELSGRKDLIIRELRKMGFDDNNLNYLKN